MAREVVLKPKNDAYTGLLAISFLALVGATVLMAMDAKDLGDPPAKLNIDVPGVTAGKAGEGLKRPDAGKIEGAPADPKGGKDPMSKAEPAILPPLPPAELTGAVLPTKAEIDPDAPPLAVKPFVPPM
jgi:hypothetical protein